MIDDDRVDETRDGVALREPWPKAVVFFRSLNLRVNEGNLRSILLVMLFAVDSAERLRLAACDSRSLLKQSSAKS